MTKDEVAVFLRDGDVLVRLADLQAAGIRTQAGRQELLREEPHVLLSSLAPRLSFEIDERELILNLTAQPSIFGFNRFEEQANRPPGIIYSKDSTGFLNYSASLREFTHASVFTEMGISLKDGLLYGAIARNEDGGVVRGLSSLTINNRASLQRTLIGDRLVVSDVLGGSLVMGGISLFREFGLDPYFVRNPGLNYSGAVATPSTVDVYVNGQFLRRVPLPPGEFELKNLPVPAGAADTRLILRDAFGREQEIGSRYYFTSGLLKEGLHEFSYNLGAKRNNLATLSWDYGPPVLLAHHRFGFTDSLTGAMRFEASPGVVSGGPGVAFRLPVGEMEVVTAASATARSPGGAAFFGFSYLGRSFSLGASARLLSPRYATTSLSASAKRSWLQMSALMGFPAAPGVGITMRYVHDNSQTDGQSHRVSLAASTRLTRHIGLFFNGGATKFRKQFANEIFTGLTFFFGETTGAVSYQRFENAGSAALTLQKSLPLGTGFGYRLQASADTGGSRSPAFDNLLQYQGPYGRYEANYTRLHGENLTLFSMAGGLALIGGKLFFTRPVQDSFALIDVAGVDGVRGYLNNQEIGVSSRGGHLVGPNLIPYYGNKLGISDKDIPLNFSIDATDRIVAPPFRGGAVVKFPIQRVQRIIGRIILLRGPQIMVPAYGQLTISTQDGTRFESPIGKQGEFYLENLPAGKHSATAVYKDQSCNFDFELTRVDDAEVNLGTLSCPAQ